MRLSRSLPKSAQLKPPSVITLGNFDGIHKGHQYLIMEAVKTAQLKNMPSIMLTFDPTPDEVFSKNHPPARLMTWIEKWDVLKAFGLDELILISFNLAFAQLSAFDFIKTILIEKLNVKHIFVGEDFRFGFKREGDIHFLKHYSQEFGYSITTHTEYYEGFRHSKKEKASRPISSTWIRDLIAKADFDLANRLLGHDYKNIGRVIYGSQLGRQLGCPTANIPMHRRKSPVHGVYVVQVKLLEKEKLSFEKERYYGVASVGHRPVIGKDLAFLLEVHLFDFSGDLYGRRLEVTYLHKLRDEWMFDSLEALKLQIKEDCEKAKQYIVALNSNEIDK